MLLNPGDFKYEYYKQSRGHDGDSGPLYLGTPISDNNLKPVLVKSYLVSDAINEYIGCNLGQRIGINTPQAWLFRPDTETTITGIDFTKAVGIEYLEGLDEKSGRFFDNHELTVQTIKWIMLHKLMGEDDTDAIAFHDGKVYAFDFASGMYPQFFGASIPEMVTSPKSGNGLSLLDRILHGFKESVFNSLRKMDLEPNLIDVSEQLFLKAFLDIQSRFIEEYNKNGFADMLEEVETVFSKDSTKTVGDFLAITLRIMDEINIAAAKYMVRE